MAEGSLECSRPSACPSSWTATRKTSLPEEKQKIKLSFHVFHHLLLPLPSFPLTTLVGVAGGPRLSEVKVRVSPDAIPREVSVSQEATLAIEGCAVAMETLGKGQHDVCKLVDLVPDVAVRDLPEGERDHALPDPEGFPDGLVRGTFANLRGVVLYAVIKRREIRISMPRSTKNCGHSSFYNGVLDCQNQIKAVLYLNIFSHIFFSHHVTH